MWFFKYHNDELLKLRRVLLGKKPFNYGHSSLVYLNKTLNLRPVTLECILYTKYECPFPKARLKFTISQSLANNIYHNLIIAHISHLLNLLQVYII